MCSGGVEDDDAGWMSAEGRNAGLSTKGYHPFVARSSGELDELRDDHSLLSDCPLGLTRTDLWTVGGTSQPRLLRTRFHLDM